MQTNQKLVRCKWCEGNELYINYHDNEWGLPNYDDDRLFELLTLEGAQAGLSWLTILKKRGNYKLAFSDFNISEVSNFNDKNIIKLLTNPGIVRNKLKIISSIKNAQAILSIQREFGSFSNFLWSYIDNKPIQHNYKEVSDLPSFDQTALDISEGLKLRGMKFVGPTICYSFMQASGMVNDHLISCFRYPQLT